jgi:hypothetical protein
MPNGLTRLASRFLGEPGRVDDLKGRVARISTPRPQPRPGW